MIAGLFKAWGFVSSPIGRVLGVGLIVIAALGYAYIKGEEHGSSASREAALEAQIETLRADVRIATRSAEAAAAQEAQAEARARTLEERLQTFENGLPPPPDGGLFTDDDVRSLRELTR